MESRIDLLEKAITCPITGEIFLNPVMANACGHTFEKEALNKWLENKNTCPECRGQLTKKNLIPNFIVKEVVDWVLEFYPQLISEQYFSNFQFHQLIKDNEIKSLTRVMKSKPKLVKKTLIDGKSFVHLAVIEGKLEALESLIENGINHLKGSVKENILNLKINKPYDVLDGATPVLLAAQLEIPKPNLLQFLINQGVNLCKPNKLGITPLIAACFSGNGTKVEMLINSGRNLKPKKAVYSGELKGKSAIHVAVEKCNNETFEKLLSIKELEINSKDSNGETALFIASSLGDIDKVKILLSLPNIDIESKNKNGKTAIQVAQENGNAEIVALFTSNEVKFSLIKFKVVEKQFNEAASIFAEIYAVSDSAMVTNYLNQLDSGLIDKNFSKELLLRTVDMAIERNDINFILRLLKNFINKNEFISGNILQAAILENKIELVKVLIENFKDIIINAQDKNGNTPICIAVQAKHDNKELIEYLLENEANLAIPNMVGETPLIAALHRNKLELVKLFLKYATDHEGDLNINQSVLETKETALTYAARNVEEEVFFEILKIANVNINTQNAEGMSPLFVAIKERNVSKIQALLVKPAIDLEAKTSNGMSALQIAEENENAYIAAIFGCYQLISNLLSEDKACKDIKLDYLLHLDQKTVNIIMNCLENQGYEKKKCKHIMSFLIELSNFDNYPNMNPTKKHFFFKDKATTLSMDLAILNRLFDIAYDNGNSSVINWTKRIRTIALTHLTNSLQELPLIDQDKKLDLARSQTIFNKHRHRFSFGRTAAMIKIDNLKWDLEKQSKKEKIKNN